MHMGVILNGVTIQIYQKRKLKCRSGLFFLCDVKLKGANGESA